MESTQGGTVSTQGDLYVERHPSAGPPDARGSGRADESGRENYGRPVGAHRAEPDAGEEDQVEDLGPGDGELGEAGA